MKDVFIYLVYLSDTVLCQFVNQHKTKPKTLSENKHFHFDVISINWNYAKWNALNLFCDCYDSWQWLSFSLVRKIIRLKSHSSGLLSLLFSLIHNRRFNWEMMLLLLFSSSLSPSSFTLWNVWEKIEEWTGSFFTVNSKNRYQLNIRWKFHWSFASEWINEQINEWIKFEYI